MEPAEQLSRVMVIDHLKKLNPNQKFYYSFTFAAYEVAHVFGHEEFLKFLRAIESAIENVPSQDVYHMSFDLLPRLRSAEQAPFWFADSKKASDWAQL